VSFIDQLSNVMTYSVAQRQAISNNISNESTPNYKAQTVSWNNALQNNGDLMITNPGHIPLEQSGDNFSVSTDNTTKVNSDGNNVDLNKEIVSMMENNQLYSMSLTSMNDYYEALGAARGR
jgi:flagellar basal-body rod protein FlgB